VGEIQDSGADITRARELLGYTPQVTLGEGISELKKAWDIA
jgi:nucleoside-diphosphate-sugar epimerase